ncbi:type I secretion protein [Sinorhizobium meliloti]|uniref:type I secretion system permease/ATPase n=1 Tax=Rhizobium meliloti TaxID=382 RepID=UPI00061489B4|nr:type I secretion system permease/ATPase [Sinorhizobium meliloti]KKA13058.1 type I secretion protein [Sinorhizobium meliloti]
MTNPSLQVPSPLAGALREIRPGLVAAGGLSLFVNLLMFVSPLYTMQIYDRVLTSRNAVTLVMISVIVAILLMTYAALEHYRARILVQAGVRLDRLLSGPAFEAALSSALRVRGSNHAQSLRDLDLMRDVLSGGVTMALMDVPWAPIYLVICFLLHPLIGLVALVGALAVVTIALVNERATKGLHSRASRTNIRAIERLGSSLRNAEAIQALGMGRAIQSQCTGIREEALGHSVSAGERGGTLLAVSKFLRMAIQVAMIGVGAYLAINQEISAGVLFAASLIMGRALAPIEIMVAQWKSVVSARGAYARLNRLFEENPAVVGRIRLPDAKGTVSVENLVVLPPGANTPVVMGATFTLDSGEIVALVGPSGSGKSSLARALVGAWPSARGCVRLDGNDLRHYDPDQLGTALGYLPQGIELFTGSVRDNIARFRADAADAEVIEAATHASAHEMIQRLPNGYLTEIGEDGVGLSGGQRQQVGLARALFGKPAVVVLDEPDANLDSDGNRALIRAIEGLRRARRTVVIVTHRPNLLSVVDRVIIMQEGRIAQMGSRDELLPSLVGANVAPAPRRPIRDEGRVGPPASASTPLIRPPVDA